MSSGNTNAGLVWAIAELLRGDYKQSEYGRVVLPFTLLRRLDCVLAPTKGAVLEESKAKGALGFALEHFLTQASGYKFYNTSPFDFGALLGDPNNLRANLGW